MKILVINGPNLNMLGRRESLHYGSETLVDIEENIRETAIKYAVEVSFFQSNHEGAIIDHLQEESGEADGIIINAGAFTHYSYAIRDALSDSNLPFVEVHLSNVQEREEFRRSSVFEGLAQETIIGHRGQGYIMALKNLIHLLSGSS